MDESDGQQEGVHAEANSVQVNAALYAGATSHIIRTENFEGPLDLLLSLIEKRKLFINDFSLAQVADEYIARVRAMEQFPTADVANFLLIASTLVLIKSKSILPELDLTREEAESVDDLKRRLALYERFRELGDGQIKTLFGRRVIRERSGRPEVVPIFAPDPRVSLPMIASAIHGVIAALPIKERIPKATIRKVISLEEVMANLTERVASALRTSFHHFAKFIPGEGIHRERKVEIIVHFLAMLELVKQGVVTVTQREDFGDIDIETHRFDVPHYT